MNLEVKSSGTSKPHYGLELSPDFWHTQSLSASTVCLPCPRKGGGGKQRSLNPLLKQCFAPLCPCHDDYLKVFTRDKDRLFTLILLLLPSWRTHRRLLINSSTGPHLSPASGNAKRRLDDCKCPPWRRKWQPTPVFLPGESHGRRNLVGYSPWGRKESNTTERLHFTSSQHCLF